MVMHSFCTGFAAICLLVGMMTVPATGRAIGVDRMDMQLAELVEVLKGKRVGMLTPPTGVDGRFRLIADRLNEHPDVELVSFFAPEHGVRGDQQAGRPEEDFTD